MSRKVLMRKIGRVRQGLCSDSIHPDMILRCLNRRGRLRSAHPARFHVQRSDSDVTALNIIRSVWPVRKLLLHRYSWRQQIRAVSAVRRREKDGRESSCADALPIHLNPDAFPGDHSARSSSQEPQASNQPTTRIVPAAYLSTPHTTSCKINKIAS